MLRYEKDGRYYLVTPVEKVPIAVEAMPFIAVEIAAGAGKAKPFLPHQCGRHGRPGASTRSVSSAGRRRLHSVHSRARLLKARSRPVYYELAALAAGNPRAREGVERRRVLPVPMRRAGLPSATRFAGARRYGAARAVRQAP